MPLYDGKVSRKLDFIPAVSKVIKGGFVPSSEVFEEHEAMMSCVHFGPWYVDHDGLGCCKLKRQPSVGRTGSGGTGSPRGAGESAAGKPLFVNGKFNSSGIGMANAGKQGRAARRNNKIRGAR